MSWGELLETCRTVAGAEPTITWVDRDFLVEQDVGQWMELPLWIDHSDPEAAHFDRVHIGRALAAGLAFRPLAETVRGALDDAETTAAAGLKPEREAELLEAWHGRGA